jgi:tRNA G10  N-methylase Trm11
MYKSILILGRQPALGIAELESLYGSEVMTQIASNVAGMNMPADAVDFKQLGGSTRLGTILSEIPSNLWKDVEKELVRLSPTLASSLPEGKIQLGLSAIGIPVTGQKMIASGLTIKKVIRSKTNRSVRLTPNQDPELNTAQVLHNHLTGLTGIELLIIALTNGNTLIARTVAVQDIDGYSLRDRGRPMRDARVGMLPPKLAQIIINLSNSHDSNIANNRGMGRLLDPFCGTGVILQEALLMGYDIYGSDLESRMITYSKANLEWLNKQYITAGISTLDEGDATNYTWNTPINRVASETYLGRPFTDTPETAILTTTIGDCNLIISKFLRNIWSQIPYGTRLCLAVPAWQMSPNQFRHLPLIDDVTELGYNRISFEHVRDEKLLYYREDQIVARELLVLTRK